MLEIESMSLGYRMILDHVIENGRDVSPRGLPTKEVPDVIIKLNRPADALAERTGRGLNLDIAAAEAIQFCGGFLDPQLLLSVSKNFTAFMDDGTFWGGYGERLENQVLLAVQKLCEDPDTRQAVITLWDKNKDNVRGKHDYPCTLSLTLQIRDGALELHTTMRSNDVWLGLPYDIFVFTQFQLTLARVLGIPPGPYYHHAVSLHLYATNYEATKEVISRKTSSVVELRPVGFGYLSDKNVFEPLRRAYLIGTGNADQLTLITDSERWYIRKLHKHITRKDA
jgi:thymidylate synthase